MEDKNGKHPGGRPSDYDPKYCDEIIEFMARGLSKEAFAGQIGVAKQTIYNWMDAHKEFLDAVKEAESKCELFWEELGLVGTTEGKNFNATTWIFNMKNRFKWKDRTDVTSDDEKLPTTIQVVNYGGNKDKPAA